MNITKELLEKEYLEKGKSWTQISKELNINPQNLRYYYRKFNIPSRKTTKNLPKAFDISGKRFGKLIVIKREKIQRSGTVLWECKCDCGITKIIRGTLLKNGVTTSCGCNKKNTGNKSGKWSGFGEISGSYWYNIEYRSKLQKHEFTITIQEAWEQFQKQQGKCLLTGKYLTFAKNYRNSKSTQTASLDRIDSSKGYVAGNICWVDKDINKMKLNHSIKHFIELCNMVVNNKQNVPQEYL
jgi:hypothetical protein